MLYGVNFRPLQEIEAIMGGGRIFDTGPFFARLRYILHMHLFTLVYYDVYLPYYLLDRTPRPLFISSCNFAWVLFESSFYLRAGTNRERHLLHSVLTVKTFVNVSFEKS